MDMAKEYQERQANGEDIAITTLLQDIMNSLLKAQRELFLQENKDNSANGFYNRNINLSIGKIKLKVPRVRFGQTFRPTPAAGVLVIHIFYSIEYIFNLSVSYGSAMFSKVSFKVDPAELMLGKGEILSNEIREAIEVVSNKQSGFREASGC